MKESFIFKRKTVKLILFFFLLTVVPITLFSQELPRLNFTQEEMIFIENHPVIKIGVDPEFVPFEFFDENGEYQGIAAEYLSLIEVKTGIKFEIIPGLTWPEAYEKAVNGEIDILPAVSKTTEREKYFYFSTPYYNIKRVIVTRDDNSSIRSFNDLKGKIVAVQENSSHHSYLIPYSNINLSLYETVPDALTAVADGRENIFMGNMATTNYLIRSEGITNLKFIAFSTSESQSLHIAVRKDLPELVTIIDKALGSITDNEKILINNKWINLELTPDYGPIMRNIMIGAGIVALIFAVSLFWIIKLKSEIKKRKLVQIDLEKAKLEAEQANNIKSSFLARMSHEIRTPLNAITGMSYLLKKTGVTLTQRAYIDRITQASSTMLSIINDILDFSKIEAGKVEIEKVSFSLDQVIREVLNIVSYKVEEQKIGFKLSKDPQIPNWFLGDPKRIEQILINLTSNAAKFTSQGEISLELKLVAKEGNSYHLSFFVKDTGIGMSKEQINKLFEPFAQGDVSINRKFGGTGLGLSIVKNLVNLMDGEIEVYSTEGEGSTFIVNITLEIDEEKEEEYRKKISSSYFKNIKTLVLEKTGSNMNIIDGYLSSFGMICELTISESSAVNMLESSSAQYTRHYDLLIMDFETPKEGGFEFLRKLKENKKITKFPKIIMLLPMTREDLYDKLYENNVDAGVSKPIIPSILFNSILETFKEKAIVANKEYEKTEEKDVSVDISVLIVEDNKTNQFIAKSLLETAGLKTLIANDGKEGVDIFKENKDNIDVILMDIHMPVLNGYEATKQIREIAENIPIIALTADVIRNQSNEYGDVYFDQFITKPFDPEDFVSKVKETANVKKVIKVKHEKVIDIDKGLQFLGNNKELFIEVLKEYYDENQTTIEKINNAIENKNYDEASKIAHKVKSSSGTIGATNFYKTAVEFQKMLVNEEKDENKIIDTSLEFERRMKEVLDEISNIIENHKGGIE